MATNEVFRDADKLSLPVPDGTLSGAPVRVGAFTTGLNGVTETSEGGAGNAEGYATVWLSGGHEVPVGTTTALAVGAPVYITSGNALTPTATGNQLFGHALTAKGTTAGVLVVVRVTQRRAA